MGAYLSAPITEKLSSDEAGKNIAYGASSMQGWRISQEDAHNCCLNFDDDVSLFAVYDGHGGHEVAAYCSEHLPNFIKNTAAYKNNDLKQALIDGFLGFDATLATKDVIAILKEIAGSKVPTKEKDNETDAEEVNNLCMEATMPLNDVIAKYQLERQGCPLATCIPIRRGKDNASSSSSGAGCSSSSSSWNSNETDVSSSSQQCSSSTAAKKRSDAPGSSIDDEMLDSTTSNGEVAPTSNAVGSTDDVGATKSGDMPDSSEDVQDTAVSPSKATVKEPTANDSEVNGEKSKNFEAADSSKSGDNVSSSCTPLENGEADVKISSTGRRKLAAGLIQYLLNKDEISEDDEDDDDDEENDETFNELQDSDDEDGEDGDEGDEDEEDEDDDDDEDEEEEDDDDSEFSLDMTEEPGSDSGCTAVVALLKGTKLYVANAGDSRCVLCRDGTAIDLSEDHKPEDQPEMDRITKAGGKVTADGRVNGGLNLSRALGDHAYKQNKDLPAEEQQISALPDIRDFNVDPKLDEFMILACDGIWNFMSSQEVVNFVRERFQKGCKTISKICEELFDHCLAVTTLGDGTGCDNMTAVIVKFTYQTSNDVNETKAEACIVSKKRPISPSLPSKDKERSKDKAIDERKRFKAETV